MHACCEGLSQNFKGTLGENILALSPDMLWLLVQMNIDFPEVQIVLSVLQTGFGDVTIGVATPGMVGQSITSMITSS